jgi:hypothetical protein
MTAADFIITMALCAIPFIAGLGLTLEGFRQGKVSRAILGMLCGFLIPVALFVSISQSKQFFKEKEQKEGPIKYELVVAGDSLYRKIEIK